jgi:methylmalonyl-CoA/ethylmalonyl-CoA epimerase
MNMKEMKLVVQVGIVVRDVEKASRLWAKLLGTEIPTAVETEMPGVTHMTYRGDVSPGRAKLAFFALENLTIELIEPIGGPSTWRDFLEKHGEGMHHIAFNVADMEKSIESLKALDIGIEQRGDFTGGCYAYTSPAEGLGAILELLGKR